MQIFLNPKADQDRKELNNVEVSAYASPDGGLKLNDKLAAQREKTSKGYVNRLLKKEKVATNVDTRYTAQDWDGFQRLVQASNLQDKDVILRVLSMYKDPEEREQQIRNMSAAFRELADGILPELRRSRLIINYETIGRSDDQIKEQYNADAAKLSADELLYFASLQDTQADQEKVYKKTAELYDKDYRAYNNLVIFMESFGATMIERLGGAKGVAPNLDRLSRQGVFFSNLYASSFRTDRGTVCTFSGYPGLPTLSIMKVPRIANSMPNIAHSLAEAGYQTDFLYGGDINFTNMRGYLLAGGFQKLTSQDDFTMEERNYGKWGVPDNLTFDRLFNMLKEREGSKQPWFTSFLTLSSHEPFEVPFSKFEDDHFNAFAYTDHCIGRFIERFSKTPQWANTLIVLLPDHGIPYPKQGERFAPHFFRIPMIWTGGAVAKPMVVDKIASQTDLAATLLAQLGIRHNDFEFSRNVLDASYTRPFAFYTFVNGFCYLDSTGVSVYDNVANRVFYNEQPSGNSQRVAKGKAILQTLYDRVGAINSGKYK